MKEKGAQQRRGGGGRALDQPCTYTPSCCCCCCCCCYRRHTFPVLVMYSTHENFRSHNAPSQSPEVNSESVQARFLSLVYRLSSLLLEGREREGQNARKFSLSTAVAWGFVSSRQCVRSFVRIWHSANNKGRTSSKVILFFKRKENAHITNRRAFYRSGRRQ